MKFHQLNLEGIVAMEMGQKRIPVKFYQLNLEGIMAMGQSWMGRIPVEVCQLNLEGIVAMGQSWTGRIHVEFYQLNLEGIATSPDALDVLASYRARDKLDCHLRNNLVRAIAFWGRCRRWSCL